jgi:hypothetical protein
MQLWPMTATTTRQATTLQLRFPGVSRSSSLYHQRMTHPANHQTAKVTEWIGQKDVKQRLFGCRYVLFVFSLAFDYHLTNYFFRHTMPVTK